MHYLVSMPIVMPNSLDIKKIAEAQASDDELQLKQLLQLSLKIKKFTLSETASNIYYDIWKEIKPYISGSLRRWVFDMVHQMSHSSSRATHRQIAQKFVWLSIAEDIKECVRTCLACQQSKIHRHNHTSPTKIPVSLEHVHIDIVGPLLPSKSFRYLLTMIDRFTRWPEAITGLYWKHIGKDIFHSLSIQIWSSTPDHNWSGLAIWNAAVQRINQTRRFLNVVGQLHTI